MTRPSWHQDLVCVPSPTSHWETQTTQGSPEWSVTGGYQGWQWVDTVPTTPWLGRGWCWSYLGLRQTLKGLHDRLLRP